MRSGRREVRVPRPHGRPRIEEDRHIVVVGGGIAGVAAATVLAERGFDVTLVEREAFLGGRAGAWSDTLAGGESFEMERGFHAFFRQYYNLRALLRRIDPELGFLLPLEDYPVHGPNGEVQGFAGLPRRAPANLISLTARSPALRLGDLLNVNKRRALEMLTYDPARTYAERDEMSARDYLDSLEFPPLARRLFFDVFAHSFFNPEAEMSAGELLMMFHFYFTGNPEGLVFDVARAPFSTAIWSPFAEYLQGLGVALRTNCSAHALHRRSDRGWQVVTDQGPLEADGVVLSLSVPALQSVVGASADLNDAAWRRQVCDLRLTNPFVVWRLWLDRPTGEKRAPFVGTTGLGPLDNISLYHLFEDESRDWASRHRGAVVELHAYAVDSESSEADLRSQLLAGLHTLYPETRSARIVEDRYLLRQDCPAFSPGSHAGRPGVETPFEGVVLAGDFVKLPMPSALMERATASGFMAANELMALSDVRSEPVRSVPPRGMLAALRRR